MGGVYAIDPRDLGREGLSDTTRLLTDLPTHSLTCSPTHKQFNLLVRLPELSIAIFYTFLSEFSTLSVLADAARELVRQREVPVAVQRRSDTAGGWRELTQRKKRFAPY